MKKFLLVLWIASWSVMLPQPAIAKSVSLARANTAVQHDAVDFPYRPHVQWCRRYHDGTLCRVGVSACFVDQVYGPSGIITHTLAWVSRTHGTVTIVAVGLPFTTIYAGEPACRRVAAR